MGHRCVWGVCPISEPFREPFPTAPPPRLSLETQETKRNEICFIVPIVRLRPHVMERGGERHLSARKTWQEGPISRVILSQPHRRARGIRAPQSHWGELAARGSSWELFLFLIKANNSLNMLAREFTREVSMDLLEFSTPTLPKLHNDPQAGCF